MNGFVVREGERVGIAARANERLVDIVKKVERGELKQKFLRVVNRRPIAILDPVGVEKAKQKTVATMPPAMTEHGTALLPRTEQSPDVMTTIASSLALMQGKELVKMFLTLDEAADLTGLTRTFLERLIHEGKLPAIRDRFVKVRRTDLLRL